MVQMYKIEWKEVLLILCQFVFFTLIGLSLPSVVSIKSPSSQGIQEGGKTFHTAVLQENQSEISQLGRFAVKIK